jgi:tetratricopeptide (TPR) repeat protein
MRLPIATVVMIGLALVPVAAQKPEATSLAGKPLIPIELADRPKLEADLAQAEKDLAVKPDDVNAIIWVGRRQAYLWRYQDAIATFSKAVALEPNNPRPYRHRGHRYITTRQFDRAITDFEKAASLIKGTPDEIEPDGAPNPSKKPRSSLHFNIWYHLGPTTSKGITRRR